MNDELTYEDRVAMAEAYRVYQMLSCREKAKIPSKFISFIEQNAELGAVKPFKSKSDALKAFISEKANYLLLYMCTFD
jgi:hypothetical protein